MQQQRLPEAPLAVHYLVNWGGCVRDSHEIKKGKSGGQHKGSVVHSEREEGDEEGNVLRGQEPDAECDWQLQDIEEQFFRVGCLQNDGFPEQRQKLAGLRVEKFG